MTQTPEGAPNNPDKQALTVEVNAAVFDFFQFLASPEQMEATQRVLDRWRNNRPRFREFFDFERQAVEVYGVDPEDDFSELPDMESLMAEESPEQHKRALELEDVLRKLHGEVIGFRFNWKSPDEEPEKVHVIGHRLECGDSKLGWGVHLEVHDPEQDKLYGEHIPEEPDYKFTYFVRMNDIYEFEVCDA